MSHNYRQARKKGFVQKDGYQMSLKTILEERGLVPEARQRNNLDAVRNVLKEMKQRGLGDCVARAIAIAYPMAYKDAYRLVK